MLVFFSPNVSQFERKGESVIVEEKGWSVNDLCVNRKSGDQTRIHTDASPLDIELEVAKIRERLSHLDMYIAKMERTGWLLC